MHPIHPTNPPDMRSPALWAVLCCSLCPGLFAHSPYQLSTDRSTFSISLFKKLIFVEARVDGQEGLFLFDTGISELTLNYDNFAHYQLEEGPSLTDINGAMERSHRVFVMNFDWQGLHREKFKVQLMDLSTLSETIGSPVLGLIGYDVIKDLEVAVDYDKRQMTLHRLDENGRVSQHPWQRPDHLLEFEMERHLPILGIQMEPGKVIRVGFDSGAAMNVLDRKYRRAAKEGALRLYHIQYNGALSATRVPYYTLPRVEVAGELSLIHCKMAFPNLSHLWRNGVQIDGLLGIDLFRLGRVSLNFRLGEMKIWVNDNVFTMKYKDLTEPTGLAREGDEEVKGAEGLYELPKSPEER